MSNVNAERNVNAKSKQSYCELNEEELDVVSGGTPAAVGSPAGNQKKAGDQIKAFEAMLLEI